MDLKNKQDMNNEKNIQLFDYTNLLASKDTISLEAYLAAYKSRITQESKILFVRDFLFPLFGEKHIKYVVLQYPFIDPESRARRNVIFTNQIVQL
jgi:hypothetical protein